MDKWKIALKNKKMSTSSKRERNQILTKEENKQQKKDGMIGLKQEEIMEKERKIWRKIRRGGREKKRIIKNRKEKKARYS